MKICWDNLENLKYSKEKKIWYDIRYTGGVKYFYIDQCKICNEPFLSQKVSDRKFCSRECYSKSDVFRTRSKRNISGKNNPMYGKTHSKEVRKRLSDFRKEMTGEKSSRWRGGVHKNNIALYETYHSKLSWCEEVRRDPEDEKMLNVKCAFCGKWYRPTRTSVLNRDKALSGKLINRYASENRFYCSEKCKKLCPVFEQKKYPKDNKPYYSRIDQKEWSNLVKTRDCFRCVKCGSTENLIAHHKEGIRWEPLESADIDMGITLCKKCEREVHSTEGCKVSDMRCNKDEL